MANSFAETLKNLKSNSLASFNADETEKLHLQTEKNIGINLTEKITKVDTDVEKVKNVDEKTIELILKSDQKINSKNGFLIEVFSSGSDGKLIRMFSKDSFDLEGNTTEEGFLKYFNLEIDPKI